MTKNGPRGNGSDLYGIDATSDGQRLWFVGGSGAIGEYDVKQGEIRDHSQPNDASNNFTDVAASSEFCSTVFVCGDSSSIYYSFEDGNDGTWSSVTPGSGAAIQAIDLYGGRTGHAVDDNQSVFHTTDGSSWTKIGIESADGTFFDVDSESASDVTVSASGGAIYTYDGSQWSRTKAQTVDLNAVHLDGRAGLTVGASGTVLRHSGAGWTQEPADTGGNLEGVSEVGEDPETAVGAGGRSSNNRIETSNTTLTTSRPPPKCDEKRAPDVWSECREERHSEPPVKARRLQRLEPLCLQVYVPTQNQEAPPAPSEERIAPRAAWWGSSLTRLLEEHRVRPVTALANHRGRRIESNGPFLLPLHGEDCVFEGIESPCDDIEWV